MPLQPAARDAGGHVPKRHDPVGPARGEGRAVGTERERPDRTGKARENVAPNARGDVPETDRLIMTRRCERLAVGSEGQREDPVGMARQHG